LRQLLLMASNLTLDQTNMASLDPETLALMKQMTMVIKYSVIVVATAPIICVYPFIQKYFVKGVMIGSVKG